MVGGEGTRMEYWDDSLARGYIPTGVQLMITLYSSITAGVKSSYVNIPSRGVRDTNLASIPNFLSP